MTETTPPTDQAERTERYAAAIRAAGDTAYGSQPFYEAITTAAITIADAEQAELRTRISELESSCRDTDRLRKDWVEMRDRVEELDERAKALAAATVPASAPTDRVADVLRPWLLGADESDVQHAAEVVLAVLSAPAACSDPIECSHEAALGEAQQDVRRLGATVDEYGRGASALAAKLKRIRDLHRETCILARGEVKPTAFTCGMCDLLDAPAAPLLPDAASGPGRADGEAQQDEGTTADKAYAAGLTDTEYRARTHAAAVAAVRAAIGGMYAHVGHRLEDVLNEGGETQQDEPEALPLLFWDEPAGVVYEEGRITAWLSKAVSLAHSVPAGQLILQPETAARLRRALTTALNEADDATAAHHTVNGARYLCHADDHYCQPAAVSQPGKEA